MHNFWQIALKVLIHNQFLILLLKQIRQCLNESILFLLQQSFIKMLQPVMIQLTFFLDDLINQLFNLSSYRDDIN
jgi:hypothetical protein